MQVEKTYQKKTQLEHILLRPDTYVGSTEAQNQQMWILKGDELVQKQIQYVPGLYKMFDEIIVNVAEKIQIDRRGCAQLKVKIDQGKGVVTIWNNGLGIPVVTYSSDAPERKLLCSSSNFWSFVNQQ